jgi:Skp family chaperone for outer membrane proteins
MSLVRVKLALVGLVLVLALVGPSAMAQQAAVIGVVDDQAILLQTKAGKAFQAEVKRQRAAFQNEVQSQDNVLRQAAQQLQAQQQSLTPEAFQKKRQDLDQQAQQARANLQSRQDAVGRSIANGERQMRDTLVKVASEIAAAKGLTLVLLRSQGVVYVNPAYDFTKDAIVRFDQKLPTLSLK